MRTIDTNIVARYIMQDDVVQGELATAVLTEPCFVSDTVLLETAWLLSSRYGMDRAPLAATLLDLLKLPTIVVSDMQWITWAIERFAAGADLADMLHIVGARDTDSFASFERRLDRIAGPGAPVRIERIA